MPEPSVIRAMRRRLPRSLPLSVALGDARDDAPFYIERAREAAAAGADIVKVGLFDFDGEGRIASFLDELTAGAGLPVVAALYADRCDAGSVARFPALAARAGAHGGLIDTYRKDGGRLFDYADEATLRAFVKGCRAHGLLSALAGSLGADDLPFLKSLAPDVAGFRGAVCAGARGEPGVCEKRLARLLDAARTAFTVPAGR